MLRLEDSTSLETFSYTSIFKTFVITFYFNKYGLWRKLNCCTE